MLAQTMLSLQKGSNMLTLQKQGTCKQCITLDKSVATVLPPRGDTGLAPGSCPP